jgi:hypothetical protein
MVLYGLQWFQALFTGADMSKLTVSGAARAVGMSRQYLYKAYIKTGKLSVERDKRGNPMVDASELIRVFGELKNTGALTLVDNQSHVETSEKEQVVIRLQAQLEAKDELLRRAEEQLRAAEEREMWLRRQLERAQSVLTDQRQPHRPWWKFW